MHTSRKGGRAKKKRASEKGREGGFGPTFLLTFSLLSYSLEQDNLFYTYV